MNKDISERDILNSFNEALSLNARDEGIVINAKWKFKVTRFDGSIEEHEVKNIVTKDGLNAIAANLVGPGTGVNSAFRYIAIGTVTAAGSLGSTQAGLGEVGRKIASTITSSNEVAILVTSWQGGADGIAGVALGTAGMINHASSGSGLLGNHVNSVATTLGTSDYLQIQMEIQIGSHNL